MRMILAATLLAAAFVGPGAQAQSSSSYRYCLFTDDAQECAYNTLEQCMASRRGTVDSCEPNNTYSGGTYTGGTNARSRG
jgi:hypothetical protein